MEDRIRFTLIGTGVPPVDANRMGTCVLVRAGAHTLLFDAGRGASLNIARLGTALSDITRIFLTHLDGDHVLGLPDVWLSSYHRTNGGRTGALPLTGPVGTKRLGLGLASAFKGAAKRWGIKSDIGFEITEFSSDGVVFAEEILSVQAFQVIHGSNAYGYRINYGNYYLVLSGETAFSENVIFHAKGADVLVHEIFDPKEGEIDADFMDRLRKDPHKAG